MVKEFAKQVWAAISKLVWWHRPELLDPWVLENQSQLVGYRSSSEKAWALYAWTLTSISCRIHIIFSILTHLLKLIYLMLYIMPHHLKKYWRWSYFNLKWHKQGRFSIRNSVMICDKDNARNHIFILQLSHNVDIAILTNDSIINWKD
jgi:hypothetical protein